MKISKNNVLYRISVRRITLSAFLTIAIFFWIFDTLYNFLWFNQEGYRFVDLLLSVHDSHTLILRILVILVLCGSGVIIGQIFKKLLLQKKESEEIADNLNITLNSIGDAVISTDISGRVINMNPVAEKLTGWTLEEAKSRHIDNIFKIINSITLEEAVSPIDTVLKNGKIVGLANHTKLISRTGEEYQISDSAAPIIDAEGQLSGVVLVFRDVTAEYQNREKMRESEERYRTLVNTSPFGIQLSDKNGKIIYSNPAHHKIQGYEDGQLIGKYIWDLIADEKDKEETKKFYDQIFLKEVTPTTYYNNDKTKDGRIIHTKINWNYIRDSKGKINWIISVIEDITEKTRAEEERDNLQSQLYQAQKMDAIGTLTGGIAHDFNNLLTPIMGYADLMHYKLPEDSPYQEYLIDIISSASKAKDLIQQLLTYSQNQPKKIDPINVVSVIDKSLKLIRSSLPATIDIEFDHETELSPIMGNETELHQIIMNVCINAAHAIKDKNTSGIGKIKIELRQVALNADTVKDFIDLHPGQHLKLSISDDGKGMSSEIMSHIFEPFFSTKEEGKGTGMGLAVVHGIVQSFQGEIKVQSETGNGSRFDIYFPISPTKIAMEAVLSEKSVKSGTGKILVLDDRLYVTNLIKQMLQPFGYKVETSNNGHQVLDILKERYDQYDLLISDFTMPQISGLDLAKKLRNNNVNLPIILLTGHGDNIQGNDHIINGILHKPVLIDELLKKIDQLLIRKEQ